jgi:transcriptional regulator with XRE-family HTH domain
MQDNVENFTKIIERLSYFIKTKGDNFNQLALNTGLSNSYFSKMLKNKGSLGEETIRKILLYYENINPEWLLLGNGAMIKENSLPTAMPNKYISEMLHLICELSEENGAMKAERKRLREEIKQLKEENDQLKG